MSAHTKTTEWTDEKVVNNSGNDLVELGDEVTFEATHFGVRQKLAARIVQFDRPNSFTDEMLKGAFQSLRHTHQFESTAEGATKMTDTLTFASPLGPIGYLFDLVCLRPYMTSFIRKRNDALKQLVESQ